MDSRCTPGRILRHHPEDQRTGLLGDFPAAADSFSRFAEHGPIQFEPSLMPPHHRLREDRRSDFFQSVQKQRTTTQKSCRMDPVWVSGACVSRRRVAGEGEGSRATGCGGCEKYEEWLRTRAQRGRTWWKSYSRSDFNLLISKADGFMTRHTPGKRESIQIADLAYQ